MGGPINKLRAQPAPESKDPSQIDKFVGTIIGLACGDALGRPTEFQGVQSIFQEYGPRGITEMPTPALYTDDTQMTVALAEGLLDAKCARNWSTVAESIASRFVSWSHSPENNRAPGSTCMGGCRNLAAGDPWRVSGIHGSRGCGAVMRVAPVGLVYRDRANLQSVAQDSATMTHDSAVGRESAHLGALAVRLLLDGCKSYCLLECLEGAVQITDPELKKLLPRIGPAVMETVLGSYRPYEIMVPIDRHPVALGVSWHADEAIASALYCFLLAAARGEGYVETVRYGANTDGDSDSIACIAGSLAGAYWGMGGAHGVPYAWGHRIENAVPLTGLAARLHKLSQEVNNG